MKVWLWSLLLLAWLSALLESVSSQWITLNDTPLPHMASSTVWQVLCYVLLAVAWQLWRLGQSQQRKQQRNERLNEQCKQQLKPSQLKHPFTHFYVTYLTHHQSNPATDDHNDHNDRNDSNDGNRLVGVVNVLSVMLAFVGISLHALLQYQTHTGNQLNQVVQVLAHIRIDGLSDGVADSRYQSHYAQTATIVYAVPLSTQSALSTQPSGIGSQDGKADTDDASIIANPYHNNNNNNNDPSQTPSTVNDTATATDAQLNAPINVLIGSQILMSAKDYQLTDGQVGAFVVSQSSQSSQSLQPAVRQAPLKAPLKVSLDALQDGQELIVPLSLHPLPDNQPNQAGFNGYRWLTARGIQAQATWLPLQTSQWLEQAQMMHNVQLKQIAEPSSFWQQTVGRLNRMRWQLREHVMQLPADDSTERQAQAVALSLLTGDRALIDKATKDLYQLAGISHLLAISGTHVLFLAIVFTSVVMAGVERFAVRAYDYLPRWQWRWGLMVGMAGVYAVFTGFDVPAARTLWMLLAVGLARWLLLPISAHQVVMAVAAVMVWFNPLVLWQAGFWLSFVAVMLLIGYEQAFVFTPKIKANTTCNQATAYQQIKQFLYLQLWMFVTLLPLSLWLFGKVSLWGVLVNLIAIGLYGWVIVPCNLVAGLLYLLSPTLADAVWAGVIGLLTHLHGSLAWLTGVNATGANAGKGVSSAWLYHEVTLGALVLGALALWLVVFFKGRHGLRAWAWLPVSAMVMVTVYPSVFLSSKSAYREMSKQPTQADSSLSKSSSPATLTLLALGESVNRQGVHASLLSIPKNQHMQHNDAQHWLILSQVNQQDIAIKDLQKTTANTLLNKAWPNKSKHGSTNDALISRIKENLASKHITRLTGIIVQSPDRQLAMLAARLSDDLQAQHWWQAGSAAFLRQLTQLEPTATTPTICQAQTSDVRTSNTHTNLNGSINTIIQPVSGFASIDDPSVWTCSLLLKFDAGIQLHSEYASPMLKVGNRQADYSSQTSPDTSPDTFSDTSLSPVYPQVFLDGGAGQRQWRLWQLWCAEQSAVSPTSASAMSASPASAWLFSHHSPLPSLMNDERLTTELQDRLGNPDMVRLSDLSEQHSAQSQQWLWHMDSLFKDHWNKNRL